MNAASYGLEQRKQRWRDFLDPQKPAQHLYMIYFDPAPPPPRPSLGWDQIPQRIEWAWECYRLQFERMQWLRDDLLPFLNVNTGTEIFAECFGCQIHRPDDNMPFALPLVTTASEAAKIKTPRLADTPLMKLFDIADELKRRGGKEAPMAIVDIQTPMDIAALIWNKSDFYTALLDTPEAVVELADKVKTLFVEFVDEWFRRYGPDFISHYPAYYMPKGLTVSEDEIGSVNSDMFLEFFLPELVELSTRYGGLGIHCCANAKHQWSNLLRIPGFKVLNMVQPVEVIKEACKFFAPHVAQMHSWSGDGAPETWASWYPGNARMVLQACAQNVDEAKTVSDKMWASCGRS